MSNYNYKRLLNPVWHKMLCSCTRMGQWPYRASKC